MTDGADGGLVTTNPRSYNLQRFGNWCIGGMGEIVEEGAGSNDKIEVDYARAWEN